MHVTPAGSEVTECATSSSDVLCLLDHHPHHGAHRFVPMLAEGARINSVDGRLLIGQPLCAVCDDARLYVEAKAKAASVAHLQLLGVEMNSLCILLCSTWSPTFPTVTNPLGAYYAGHVYLLRRLRPQSLLVPVRA